MIDYLKKYLPVIKSNPLFRNMTDDNILALLQECYSEIKTYPKGAVLIPARSVVTHVTLLLTGRMKTVHESYSYNDSLVQQFYPGDAFGMAFCVKKSPCLVTLKTSIKSQVIQISYQKLMTRSNHSDIIKENIFQMLASRVIMHAEKVDYMYLRRMRSKLCAFLLNCAERSEKNIVYLQMNRTQLAEYLGVSRSAMVRELSAMEKEGLISLNGRQINVIDAPRLLESTME